MKIILTLVIVVSFVKMNLAQNVGSIIEPGWTKAKSEINKNKIFIEKNIAEYGYSFNELTILKNENGYNKGIYHSYSKKAKSCYINISEKYSSVWPKDKMSYSFILKAPKNSKGLTYTFDVNVVFLRSKFSGEKKCSGKLLGSYYNSNLTVRVRGVEGTTIKEKHLLYSYFKHISDLKYRTVGKNRLGIISIDSLQFIPLETAQNRAAKYKVIAYNKMAEYDDFMPIKFYQEKVVSKYSFSISDVDKMLLSAYKLNDIDEESEQIMYEVNNTTKVYEFINSNPERKTIDYYKNDYELEAPQLSKAGLYDTYTELNKNMKLKSLKEFKNTEYIKSLFEVQGGDVALEALYEYYSELKNGLWVIEKEDIKYRTWAAQGYKEGIINVKINVDRNLTKEELSSIKGKVSNESYKHAKTHTGGYSTITIKLKLVEGHTKIYYVKINSYNKARD